MGDRYVSENMRINDHSLGGENSGHIIFRKHAVTGDGILTSLKLMEVMLEKKMKLSELGSKMKPYPQVLKNVRVVDRSKAIGDSDVAKAIEDVGGRLGENGRILVRESGTEPVIRILVEAGDMETCEREVSAVYDVLKNKGHIAG